VRTAWSTTENEELIGLVGRLDPVKGHPTLLKAASLLVSKRQDVRFVCVGWDPETYRIQLQRLGLELGLRGRLL
jgi:glycosyltransferase involved in cell wall biosynthesis